MIHVWLKGLNFAGMYSKVLREAEITYPKKVTPEGRHLSQDTTHFHGGPSSGALHYNITLADRDHFLILHPEENFLAPSIVIERRRRDAHVRTKPRIKASKCHYRGIVRGEPNSLVAMSACNGLVFIHHSFFYVQTFKYYITFLFSYKFSIFSQVHFISIEHFLYMWVSILRCFNFFLFSIYFL